LDILSVMVLVSFTGNLTSISFHVL